MRLLILASLGLTLFAQTKTPHAAAPVDLTGYWVSAITEDWRYRMVTAPKGDFAGVPLNADGRKAAEQWDPAKDIASGEQCRAFGAGGIMRMPVRLHITWQDETTLKMEVDNGNQIRLLHFDKVDKSAAPSWQGVSSAEWETVTQGQALMAPGNGGGGVGGFGASVVAGTPLSGSLKVVTTNMRPGYLRRNGIPYTGNAVMTEFLDRTLGPNSGSPNGGTPNGDDWLILTSILDDPQYLQMPFMLSTHYKREPDGGKFNPRPCEVTLPLPIRP